MTIFSSDKLQHAVKTATAGRTGGYYHSMERAFLVNILLAPMVPMLLVSSIIVLQYDYLAGRSARNAARHRVEQGASMLLALQNAAGMQGIAATLEGLESFPTDDHDVLAVFGADGDCVAASPAGFCADADTLVELFPDDPSTESTESWESPAGTDYVVAAADLGDGNTLLLLQPEEEVYGVLRWARLAAIGVILLAIAGITIKATKLARKMTQRIARTDQEKQRLNEQMFQTGKLASIGELASGVAHEINNPIAVMIEEAGWMQDLLDDMQKNGELPDNENGREFTRALEQIRIQGARCKEITAKLLSFARQSDADADEADVGALLDDLLHVVTRRAAKRGVTVNATIEPDLPPVKVSHSELQQVLFNLINNSLDAMDPQGGELTIGATRIKQAIRVDIADTGEGIPKDQIDRVFDPFYTTKPVGRGTGLGLSICYGLVRKWGGRIHAESEPGRGARFWFTIPVWENDAASPSTAEA